MLLSAAAAAAPVTRPDDPAAEEATPDDELIFFCSDLGFAAYKEKQLKTANKKFYFIGAKSNGRTIQTNLKTFFDFYRQGRGIFTQAGESITLITPAR